MNQNTPFEKRFWSKVVKGPSCWEWTGYCDPKGYGRIHWRKRQVPVHRAAYEYHIGPIPDGMHVLHRCDNPPCVNPDHLFLGTTQDNSADMVAKGRGRTISRPGSLNPPAKLNEVQVVEIRRLYADGILTRPELARNYGVSHTAICYILSRRTWRHVA